MLLWMKALKLGGAHQHFALVNLLFWQIVCNITPRMQALHDVLLCTHHAHVVAVASLLSLPHLCHHHSSNKQEPAAITKQT